MIRWLLDTLRAWSILLVGLVPGNYILVDHALSRAERGLVGILQVEGQPNPEIFEGKVEAGSGH